MNTTQDSNDPNSPDFTESDQIHPAATVVDGPPTTTPTPIGISATGYLTHYEVQFADLPLEPAMRLGALEAILEQTIEAQFKGFIAVIAEGLAWKDIQDRELFRQRSVPDGRGGTRPMLLAEYIESLEISGIATSPSMVYKKIIAADLGVYLRQKGVLLPRNLNQSHLLVLAELPRELVIPALETAMVETKNRPTAEALKFAGKKVKAALDGGNGAKPEPEKNTETQAQKIKALIASIQKCANIGLKEIELKRPEAGKSQFVDILRFIEAYCAPKPKAARRAKGKKGKRGKRNGNAPKVVPPNAGSGAGTALEVSPDHNKTVPEPLSQERVPSSANGDAASVAAPSDALPTAANPRELEGYSLWVGGAKVFVRIYDGFETRPALMNVLKFVRNDIDNYWSKNVLPPQEMADAITRVVKVLKPVASLPPGSP